MDNLSKELNSLFVGLQNKLPSFDDFDESNLADEPADFPEIVALEAAYPVLTDEQLAEEVKFISDSDADFISTATELFHDPNVKNELCASADFKESSMQTCSDTSGIAESTKGHEKSEIRDVASNIPSTENSKSVFSQAQRESRELVERYFPSTGVVLTSSVNEKDNMDQVFEFLDCIEVLEAPDCFQQAEAALNNRRSRNINSSDSDFLPFPSTDNMNNTSNLVLEKLILHAAKYDEGLKVKDFDLKSGSLKSHRKQRHKRRERVLDGSKECWLPDNDVPSIHNNTCSRGTCAVFPLEDLPALQPTVYLDLRNEEEALEEKRRHVKRVQSILRISSPLNNDDTSSEDSSDDQ